MKHLILWAMTLFITLATPAALVADEAEVKYLHDLVNTKITYITNVLNDANISKAEKDQKILAVAEEMIDFDIMAKLSLGKEAWVDMNSSQRTTFVPLFADHIKNSYIEKLYLYNGQEVRIDPAVQTKSNRIQVPSFIIGADSTTEVLYKFYRNKARKWFIYDINLAGVSVVKANQTQFAEYLKTATPAQLIEKLRNNRNGN